MTTWHVMMPTENESDATHSHDVSEGEKLSDVWREVARVWFNIRRRRKASNAHSTLRVDYLLLLISLKVAGMVVNRDGCPLPAGRQLLLKAVNRVWTELMHSKRQMLEDIFKVSLPCNDRGHVDIATARPALEELALKSWQNHLGEERVEIST